MRINLLILASVLLSVGAFASNHDSHPTTNIAKLFPNAAQSHNSNGKFDSQAGAKVIGARNHAVDFKRHGSLGKCIWNNSEQACSISRELAPPYKLNDFDKGKDKELTTWYLDKPTNIPSSSREIVCGWDSTQGMTLKDNAYKSIVVKSSCTLSPDSDEVANVIIEEKLIVDGTLYLKPGNYFLNKLELRGSGKIKTLDSYSGEVNLYIKNNVDLGRASPLGSKDNPINIFYDDKLEIKGSVKVSGMVRAKSIDIKGNAELNLTPGVYWYEKIELSSNKPIVLNTNELTTFHVKYKVEMSGSSTVNENNKPLLLFIHNENSSSLDLQGSAHLYGYIYSQGGVEMSGGTRITGAVNVVDLQMSGGAIIDNTGASTLPGIEPEPDFELPPEDSYGYIYGTIKVAKGVFDILPDDYVLKLTAINSSGGLVELVDSNSHKDPLKKYLGEAFAGPFSVTYDKAERISLEFIATNNQPVPNKLEIPYKVDLTFVPKTLVWVNNSSECGSDGGNFNYLQHHDKCKVLGKAGGNINLTLQVFGEGEKTIVEYEVSENNLATVVELDAEQSKYNEIPETSIKELTFQSSEATVNHKAIQVGLIEATVKAHCALYAIKENKECGLMTGGDKAILGRTVPARLEVTGVSGKVTNNIAYRAKPVEFILPPAFTVKGCANSDDSTCKELSSFSGEFAKGLSYLNNLTLTPVNNKSGELTVSGHPQVMLDENNNKPGHHTVLVSDLQLLFAKQEKVSSQKILQQLKLTIDIKQDSYANESVTGDAQAKLDEDANLRFGFLTLEDTDLDIDGFSLEKPGEMKTTLNYYGTSVSDIQQVVQNNDNKYNLSGLQSKVEALSEGQRPNLVVAEKAVKVTPATSPTEWQGNVSIELTGPDYVWLKPYDDNKKQLSNPQGRLTISGRKRGNDRLFNRREALQ